MMMMIPSFWREQRKHFCETYRFSLILPWPFGHICTCSVHLNYFVTLGNKYIHSDSLRLCQQNFPVLSQIGPLLSSKFNLTTKALMELLSCLLQRPLFVSMPAHRNPLALWRWRAPAIEGVIYGSGGNGNKDEPKGSTRALCTLYWVPLDVTGDKLCEGQKQTTQQKQADVDKGRHTGLIIGELREFSGKMPPRFLAEPSNPIRPVDGLL